MDCQLYSECKRYKWYITYNIAFTDSNGNAGTIVTENTSGVTGVTVDNTPPTTTGNTKLTSSNSNGSYAKNGDTLTLEVTFDEPVSWTSAANTTIFCNRTTTSLLLQLLILVMETIKYLLLIMLLQEIPAMLHYHYHQL